MTTLTIATALAVGYLLGRCRPGPHLLDWAMGRANGSHAPGWWLAQTVLAARLAYIWTVHPRRTLANVRSWRQAERREPAPQIDPHWPAKRRATDTTEETDR